ncbi:uncharacterized protein [Spinacia oleracea]|uniref:Endonuclease/exonuclease/phosphatase domain-containing protein n=1 Tax=Spinacia oleracea TaxID=3562 RepID=A0A9R0JZG9_SPIOL|nr:uncharacterized protein LOC110791814 [Spinacia oleracea]
MNDPSKVVEIKKFLGNNNVSVVALVETKVKCANSGKVQKKFGSGWRWIMNYTNSPRGRIWVGWKHDVITFQPIFQSDQLIHGCISAKNGKFRTTFTAVYGLHSIGTRKTLWNDLTQLSSVTTGEWIVMGDFNSVLYSGDRINGNPVTHAETRDFEGCIDATDLNEIKSRGHFYSWSNKGQGQTRICSRIDRVFGNTDWHSTFLDAVVDYLNPGISDHSPLLLSCNINVKTGGRPFKFFNYMADHDEFMQVVQEKWNISVNGTPMFTVWQKMKAIKGGLKHLHHRDFSRLEERIELLRKELDGIQTQLATSYTDQQLQDQEKECSLKLKKFLKVQESAYKQKSRIQWLKEDAIKEEIKGFYVNLIGTAAPLLTSIDIDLVRKGNQLSAAAAEDLIQPVTNMEIDAALKGIDNNKAPGIDGFNSLFFKKTWGIVKEDVYDAIKHFFLTRTMLQQVNNTVVTLVPKVQNATHVKDFRPIA